MSLLDDFLNRKAEPQESERAGDHDREVTRPTKNMGKTPSEELIYAIRKKVGKINVSGIARLLERSGSTLTAISYESGWFTLSIQNESGEATVRIPDNLPPLIASACISGPTQELFEAVRDNLWQADVVCGARPLAILPLNAAIWKLAGMGEEVVEAARNTDFDFGHHIDRHHYELAQVGRLFGVLDEKTRENYAASVATQLQPPRRAIMGWMRHEWKIAGPTLPVREELKRLVKRKANLTAGDLLVMASFFADAGEYGYALSLLKAANKASPNIWSRTRIPALTHLLVREGLLKEPWAHVESDMVDYIMENEGNFTAYIRTHRDSFAVVANGPRQAGLGTGSVIDAKNVVIRLNTGRANASFEKDYGIKQTVWIRSLQNYDVKRSDKISGIDHLVISGSNPLYRISNSGSFLREMINTYGNVTFIPEEFLRRTIALTERNPSSGIVTLTWLNAIVGSLQDQSNVFGYSLNDQKTRQTNHYFRAEPIISHHTHNWDVERAYFDTIVKPE